MKVKSIDVLGGELVLEGTRRRVLMHSENIMLVYYEIDPGAVFPSHNHPHEQIGFIIKGTGEFTVEGEKIIVDSGCSYFIEPNETHGFRILGEETCLLLDIFYPPRQDYIKPE
jgi:quercetin dioxygenase-like cupin family protein